MKVQHLKSFIAVYYLLFQSRDVESLLSIFTQLSNRHLNTNISWNLVSQLLKCYSGLLAFPYVFLSDVFPVAQIKFHSR